MAETDFPIRTFKEQLESVPQEFTVYMEEYREAHFIDLIAMLNREFNLSQLIEDMSEEEQDAVIKIFKTLHNFGFYGGVSYTLDPQQLYVPKYTEEAN